MSGEPTYGAMLLRVEVLASLGIWDAGLSAPGWKNEPE